MPRPEPGNIDVSLNIVSDEIMQDFVNRVEQLQDSISEIKFAGMTPRGPQGSRPATESRMPDIPPPSDAVRREGGRRPPQREWEDPNESMWGRLSRKIGKRVAQIPMYEGDYDFNLASGVAEGSAPRPGTSTGGSGTLDGTGLAPRISQALETRGRGVSQNAISIPRFGDWTVQDTLRMAAGAAGKVGGPQSTRAAGALDQLAEWSSYASRIGQHLNTMTGLQSPMATYHAAKGAGLEGGITVAPFGIGGQIPDPFSEAGQYTLKAYGAGLEGAIKPGITAKEGVLNQTAATRLGFRDEGDSDLFASELDRLSAATASEETSSIRDLVEDLMSQTFRYEGAEGVRQIIDTASEWGEVSKTARLNIADFAQSVANTAEELENFGLTVREGVRAATDFSRATGLAPELGMDLMNKVPVQAELARMGFMPHEQGLAFENQGLFLGAANTAIQQMRTSAPNLGGQSFTYGKGRNQVTLGVSAKDRQDAWIAEVYGFESVKQFRKYERGLEEAQYRGMASDVVGEYKKNALQNPGMDLSKTGRGTVGMDDVTHYMRKGGVTEDEVRKAIEQEGFGDTALGDLSPKEQAQAMKRAINNETRQNRKSEENRVRLDLTPWAKALVREQGGKPINKKANQGQENHNEGAVWSGNFDFKPNQFRLNDNLEP